MASLVREILSSQKVTSFPLAVKDIVFGFTVQWRVCGSPLQSDNDAFILLFSTLVLNSELHYSSSAYRPTLDDFIYWVHGVNVPRDLLEEIYSDIRSRPLYS